MLWTTSRFIPALQHHLLLQLPGLPAQLRMAPPSREAAMLAPPTAKLGGVMIVLFEKNKEWHILLMQRTADGGTHSGQISLPGGKHDAQDGTITYTAIRELAEEMGIGMQHISLLGGLTPLYIPPSNFYITPIVCHWHTVQALQPSVQEVAQILEIPLQQLFDTNNLQQAEVYRSDDKTKIMHAPIYKINEELKIWGATAMVLSELEVLMKEAYEHNK
jgi:8-oxo-dGTP pyrophosphatase MutT (NUDIX family)